MPGIEDALVAQRAMLGRRRPPVGVPGAAGPVGAGPKPSGGMGSGPIVMGDQTGGMEEKKRRLPRRVDKGGAPFPGGTAGPAPPWTTPLPNFDVERPQYERPMQFDELPLDLANMRPDPQPIGKPTGRPRPQRPPTARVPPPVLTAPGSGTTSTTISTAPQGFQGVTDEQFTNPAYDWFRQGESAAGRPADAAAFNEWYGQNGGQFGNPLGDPTAQPQVQPQAPPSGPISAGVTGQGGGMQARGPGRFGGAPPPNVLARRRAQQQQRMQALSKPPSSGPVDWEGGFNSPTPEQMQQWMQDPRFQEMLRRSGGGQYIPGGGG